jgi:hypothetical protein
MPKRLEDAAIQSVFTSLVSTRRCGDTQCVLTKFSTDEYKGLANINHFDVPFRTEDDDDDDPEFDDSGNIEGPPYPSYLLDLAWSRRCQEVEKAEQPQDRDLLSPLFCRQYLVVSLATRLVSHPMKKFWEGTVMQKREQLVCDG